MSLYVVDASAAAEYLLRTSLGLKVAEIIEGSLLLAPELLDVEVLSVFRRAVLRRELREEHALRDIDDLMDCQSIVSRTNRLFGQHGNTAIM